ncbi:PEP-CTERM putative exosortase interaction domain-containing protein [Rivularia sp. PCC 7116]|uniref:LEVG family PEP-CTERM protein n=1 Tax=Rivularia sp. PCC 7116 TaxID=373994 RepID=UPI00029EE65F|nr:LEVG family PEP-CTERM protein [Rivularia sp. PCC 7116]AFY54901.1 PEP-CTERM putative exosortase interaction domain-containing protein [Rivularia sp. PCC 7116]AFY54902.1 PEP-CTERM putative exosortase interaction domain-containing protein [Rivularia sp. PCC 7116]
MKNIKKLVKTLAAVSTIGLGFATVSVSQAQAASLVPQIEGEIETNLGCLDPSNCIDTADLDFGYSVTSLKYDFDGKGPQFVESRLFSDDRSTRNDGTNGTFDLTQFGITFLDTDEGTNPNAGTNWFRAVAYEEGSTTPFEDGRLEVGRFKFDFNGKTANEVRLDFFDVEDGGFSGILEVNGQELSGQMLADMLLPAGPDSNIQTLVLKNVNDFVVQMGNPGPDSVFSNTGDGVSLEVKIPESENIIGLSALAVAGVITLKRRKRASQKA